MNSFNALTSAVPTESSTCLNVTEPCIATIQVPRRIFSADLGQLPLASEAIIHAAGALV